MNVSLQPTPKKNSAETDAIQQFAFSDTSVVDLYDEILVPKFFRACADILLGRAGLRRGSHVLDLACGPGTVAHSAALQVGPEGRVVGTDISPHMLAKAEQKCDGKRAAAIEWVEAPASPLPLEEQSFDAAFCQQGFQYFPDAPAAARELARTLRPGGRAFVAVWAPIDTCTVFAAMRRTLIDSGLTELGESICKPFSWPGPDALTHTLQEAGLKDVRVSRHTIAVRYNGESEVLKSFDATPIGIALRMLEPSRMEGLKYVLGEHTRHLRAADGTVSGTMVTLLAEART